MKILKPLEKEEARVRRDGLMEKASHARLSLKEGVREMRTISGLTQDQFAEHRGISTRVIKALELGQGNPTVGTLNRIAEFYGLEVGFVPSKHVRGNKSDAVIVSYDHDELSSINESFHRMQVAMAESQNRIEEMIQKMNFDEALSKIAHQLQSWEKLNENAAGLIPDQQKSTLFPSSSKSKQK